MGDMMFLDRILSVKREEVEYRRSRQPVRDLRSQARDIPPARDFFGAVKQDAGTRQFRPGQPDCRDQEGLSVPRPDPPGFRSGEPLRRPTNGAGRGRSPSSPTRSSSRATRIISPRPGGRRGCPCCARTSSSVITRFMSHVPWGRTPCC